MKFFLFILFFKCGNRQSFSWLRRSKSKADRHGRLWKLLLWAFYTAKNYSQLRPPGKCLNKNAQNQILWLPVTPCSSCFLQFSNTLIKLNQIKRWWTSVSSFFLQIKSYKYIFPRAHPHGAAAHRWGAKNQVGKKDLEPTCESSRVAPCRRNEASGT